MRTIGITNWRAVVAEAGKSSRVSTDLPIRFLVGVFEFENFSKGTISLGEAIAQSTTKGAFSLVGGGDSVAAVKQFGFEDRVSYVSTGGGAMLESLEGKDLPGIAALMD